MIRRLIQGLWLFPLGLALAVVMPGCSEPNESEFKEGGGEKQGVADPKYAHGTPDNYKQFYKEAKNKSVPVKALKSEPSKSAPGKAEPPPPQAAKPE
jgi:hypothetical protein